MNDTHPDIERLWRQKWREKSPEDRFLIGCRMFDTAKIIAESAIQNENPSLSPQDHRRALFRRLYGPHQPCPF